MKKIMIVFTCFNMLAVNLFSEKELGLKECIARALNNNSQIKSAGERLRGGKEEIKSVSGLFYPRIELAGNFTLLDEAQSMNILGRKVEIGQVDNYSAKVSVSQSLYTWGRIANSYKISKLTDRVNELTLQKTKFDVTSDIKKIFFTVISLQELEKNLNDSYDSLKKHRDQIKVMYENGTASKFDLLRSEVQLTSLIPQIDKVKSGIKTSKIGLKTLMNADDPFEISGRIEFIKFEKTLDDLLKLAEERPDIKAMKIQMELSDYRIKIISAGDKPSLIAVWNYQAQRPYQTLDEWGDSWNAVFVLSYPVFDGLSTRKKVNSLVYQDKALREDIAAFIKKVNMDIEAAYIAINLEKSNLLLSDKLIEQSKEALKIARERYSNGLLTNLEYLDSEFALDQAKSNKIQSLSNYIISLINLEKSCGAEFIE